MSEPFSMEYEENVRRLEERLVPAKNFDILEKKFAVGQEELTAFTVDGLCKDAEAGKLFQYFGQLTALGDAAQTVRKIPHLECEVVHTEERATLGVLSGQTLLCGTHFGDCAILVDLRTYPDRSVAEPEGDRVMHGARDGFTETLLVNTALLRRRLRDPALRMEHFCLSGISGSDVVICYIEGRADEKVLRSVRAKIQSARPEALTMGMQSLAETLIRHKWYNPFPKIRTTERPDTAAAQVAEGSVLILTDTSPQAMILPTSIFDYLQQTGDYYYPPLTGSYLRVLRTLILALSVIATPLWFLLLQIGDALPEGLRFLIPSEPGALPILLQLYLAEIAIDGLKIASMNTPDILSNSLSVVGALLLSDFAVGVGWLCRDVILYMSFVAIATFAQQNHELGYAFKFMRMILLALTGIFGAIGFIGGVALICALAAANESVGAGRGYLYPLVPFNPKALSRLLFRRQKADFREK